METPYDEMAESLRKKLARDPREIDVEDLGAGSKHVKGNRRKISDIASQSLSTARYSSLYLRMARHLDARNIVELGTSLGINTLYLARQTGSRVYTFEGSPAVAEIASLSFEFAGVNNIEMVVGNLENTLYTTLSRLPKIDLAFMDANHRLGPTLRYFELLLARTHHRSVIIMDDIHDSTEMEKAWSEVKRHPLVYTTADLFRCGIIFFDPRLTKQHVVLRF